MLLKQDKLQTTATETKVYKHKTSKDEIKCCKSCMMGKPVQYVVYAEKSICSTDEGYQPTNFLTLNTCPHDKK